MQRKVLGKGLKALFPETNRTDTRSSFFQLNVELVKPNPDQPRTHFSSDSLEELSRSIKEKGVIQPIVVRKKNNTFILIAGERRLRAVKRLGMKTIPAVVRESEGENFLELSLIENIQREDLNPIEEAKAYNRLMEEFYFTQEEIASHVGKARSTIANFLRLFQLPKEIQNDLADRRLTMGHAKVLLMCPDRKSQLELRNKILSQNLSVRTTEGKGTRSKTSRPRTETKSNIFLKALEQELQEKFFTKVTFIKEKKGGKIVIGFSSDEELERIIELLKK